MSTPNLQELLRKPAESVERPKPLPGGTYNGMISNREFGESKEKKTPYVRFMIQLVSPGNEIDPTTLEGIDLSKKKLRRDFFLTLDAEYRLVEFAESCGIDKHGRSLAELIEECLNKPVLVEVTQRPSQDGSELYNDVANMKGAQ
jgi:hypothetical protein